MFDLIRRETGLAGSRRLRVDASARLRAPPPPASKKGEWDFLKLPPGAQLVATYRYTTETDSLVFEVLRFGSPNSKELKGCNKTFKQRRPDSLKRGGWSWSLKGLDQRPLYRLPEVIETLAHERVIVVVEGEKNADHLCEIGVPATCNSGGAKNWRDERPDVQ